jgi:hypothetical protein
MDMHRQPRRLIAAAVAIGLMAGSAQAGTPKLRIQGYEQGGAERLTVQLDESAPLIVYRVVLNRKFNTMYCDTSVGKELSWVSTPEKFGWNPPIHLNYGDYFEVGTGDGPQCTRIVSLLLQTNQGWLETKW